MDIICLRPEYRIKLSARPFMQAFEESCRGDSSGALSGTFRFDFLGGALGWFGFGRLSVFERQAGLRDLTAGGRRDLIGCGLARNLGLARTGTGRFCSFLGLTFFVAPGGTPTLANRDYAAVAELERRDINGIGKSVLTQTPVGEIVNVAARVSGSTQDTCNPRA